MAGIPEQYTPWPGGLQKCWLVLKFKDGSAALAHLLPDPLTVAEADALVEELRKQGHTNPHLLTAKEQDHIRANTPESMVGLGLEKAGAVWGADRSGFHGAIIRHVHTPGNQYLYSSWDKSGGKNHVLIIQDIPEFGI